MQVNWQFNANQYEPNQGFGNHPPAQKVPFTITATEIKSTKDSTPENPSGYLAVEYTSPLGSLTQRYNIKNSSPKAVEIAYGQLSALCRAVGIYNIDGNNECAALRGGKGLMDVGYQKDEEPNPQFPDRKGYTELKRVYDINGNDPSKPGAAPAQPQTQGLAPAGPTPQVAQQQPQAQQQAPQGQAWQPGAGQPGAAPPWGNR